MYMDSESGMRANSHAPIVEQYRDYYNCLDSFEEKSLPGSVRDYRWEVSHGYGEGFAELLRLNSGPNVGLCGFQLEKPLNVKYREHGPAFRFCLLLTGDFRVSSLDGRQVETVRSGDVWFCAGGEGEARCYQPSGKLLSGVSIEVSRSMLDSWLGGTSCELSRSLEKHLEMRSRKNDFVLCGSLPKARSLPASHSVMISARSLFGTQRNTVCGRLQFESLALDFLSQMLTLEEPLASRPFANLSQRQRAADEARSILDEEWGSPPTITSLSRRVGINECYLKTDFRERTGQSIGVYVRKLRMEKALELIESGRCSVLQAATFVGYSNPSHFSRAFKRFHGRLPSSYLTRS